MIGEDISKIDFDSIEVFSKGIGVSKRSMFVSFAPPLNSLFANNKQLIGCARNIYFKHLRKSFSITFRSKNAKS